MARTTVAPTAQARDRRRGPAAAKPMPADGGDSEATLAEFAQAGIDVDALAARLQGNGAKSFVEAWNDLVAHIDEQGAALGALSATSGGAQ